MHLANQVFALARRQNLFSGGFLSDFISINPKSEKL
jgi:hypothetical protein